MRFTGVAASCFVRAVVAFWLVFGDINHVSAQDITSACTLCFDGSPTPRPDQDVTIALPRELLLEVSTCGEVEEYLAESKASAVPPESELCHQLENLGALYCGCPAVPYDDETSTCSLCVDGSEPVQELLNVVVMRKTLLPETTCRDLHAQASLPFHNGFGCDESQWMGYKFCGCPPPAASVDDPTIVGACELDCDIPESKWQDTAIAYPWKSEKTPAIDWTCGDVEAFTRMTRSKKGCAILAAAANGGCGCPVPSLELGEALDCPVCPNTDNRMPLASTLNIGDDDGLGLTCFNALYTAVDYLADSFLAGRDETSCFFVSRRKREECCPHTCKDKAGQSRHVVLRDGGGEDKDDETRMTCADIRSIGYQKNSKPLATLCENQPRVRKKCRDLCGTCFLTPAQRECKDADESVTFRKVKVRKIPKVCEWLATKAVRKIAQICKDNRKVRQACGKTCNLEVCEENDHEGGG